MNKVEQEKIMASYQYIKRNASKEENFKGTINIHEDEI